MSGGSDFQDYVKRESGGRSQLSVVERVRKEAADERKQKLSDEIRFLRSIPEEWKQHFPAIVLSHIAGDRVFYEMPSYQLPTLRRLIFSGTIGHREALKWVDKILGFCFQMYERQTMPVPTGYMDYMHTRRLKKRLAELQEKTDVFKRIIGKKHIEVNGKSYLNTPLIFERIREEGLLKMCRPPYVSRWAHSDLHFSNVLIDIRNDNFILLDPRGYKYCDYYYDFGKLWHSVNGKYEFIAEYKFKAWDSRFRIERNEAYHECEKIKASLPDVFMNYSKESRSETMMKTQFNEAVHFASLVPFILDFDQKETRARVAYNTGAILLNEFYERFRVTGQAK